MTNFKKLARIIINNGGSVSFEWPKCCALWRDARAISMVKEFNMQVALTDGCAHGLVALRRNSAGIPIRKTFMVATTCTEIKEVLDEVRCPGTEVHERHARCEQSDTRRSGQ